MTQSDGGRTKSVVPIVKFKQELLMLNKAPPQHLKHMHRALKSQVITKKRKEI